MRKHRIFFIQAAGLAHHQPFGADFFVFVIEKKKINE
jgi:hypothetical protein